MNGTAEERAEYEALATEFYNEVKEFNFDWSENGGDINFDPAKSPIEW